jgi:hypothetical protein
MARRALRALLLLAVTGMGGTGPVCAQELGRLFSTPAERTELERLRHGGKPAPVAAPIVAADSDAEPVREPAEQVMVINGYVTRSGSGRATTWVNSVPHASTDRLAGGVALAGGRTTSSVAVTLRSGRQVQVRAGQTVDPVSGAVREGYAPAPPRR